MCARVMIAPRGAKDARARWRFKIIVDHGTRANRGAGACIVSLGVHIIYHGDSTFVGDARN